MSPAEVPSPSRPAESRPSARLTTIVPTRNEQDNVRALVHRLTATTDLLDVESDILFVDDSDDDTVRRIHDMARDGFPVRVLHRPPRFRHGGLSGAVVAGLANCAADVAVVIDGDLQHPPEMVEPMAAPILAGRHDLTIATRYVEGGDASGLDSTWRRSVSRASARLSRGAFPQLRDITDPCSGFFALDMALLENVVLRPTGFKILLEILVRTPWQSVGQVPFAFGEREAGASKASLKQGFTFLGHVGYLRATTTSRNPVEGDRVTDARPVPAGIDGAGRRLRDRLPVRIEAPSSPGESAGTFRLADREESIDFWRSALRTQLALSARRGPGPHALPRAV